MWRRVRGWRAIVVAFFAAALATVAASDMQKDETHESPDTITVSEVLAAQRAWDKLRSGLEVRTLHAARRREVIENLNLSPSKDSAKWNEKRSMQVRAVPLNDDNVRKSDGRSRALLTEYTLDAESSFTAVSKALDALANRARIASSQRNGNAVRSAIATNTFEMEGTIDADTIKGYLNSRIASESLARTEANALRKVVGTLLQTNAKKDTANGDSRIRLPRSYQIMNVDYRRQRVKRNVPQFIHIKTIDDNQYNRRFTSLQNIPEETERRVSSERLKRETIKDTKNTEALLEMKKSDGIKIKSHRKNYYDEEYEDKEEEYEERKTNSTPISEETADYYYDTTDQPNPWNKPIKEDSSQNKDADYDSYYDYKLKKKGHLSTGKNFREKGKQFKHKKWYPKF